MPVYICLLRGINVGGKRMKMEVLREMFSELAIPDAKTLLASGNVVFQADERDTNTFVETIETAIQKTFGFESKIIMRTQEELEAIIKKNPFSMDELESKYLHVCFLRDKSTTQAIEAFHESHESEEVVHVLDREVFIYYTNGAGRSKLSIEKALNVIGTARNWNTVLKLQSLAEEVAQA